MTPDSKTKLIEISGQMTLAGLPPEFVAAAVDTSLQLDGVYDLIHMWSVEDDAKERGAIISDIQELIDDYHGIRTRHKKR